MKNKRRHQLKDNKNDIRKNINISQPIIIRQTFFNGKSYDLLLILEQNNKTYAIFIQIGLNKNGIQINKYLKNLKVHYNQYLEGINTLINHKIDALGFMLIFDYEYQKNLKENNNQSEGIGFCIKNNIDFLIYKNYKLVKNLDDNEPINNIQVTEKTLIFIDDQEKVKIIDIIREKFGEICKNISLSLNLETKFPLNKEEKDLVLEYIKKNFKSEYNELDFAFNIGENFTQFKDFGIIDSENFSQINIFINKNLKFFSYNNKIFKISKKKIVEFDKSKANSRESSKYNWDLYFLKKKRKFD